MTDDKIKEEFEKYLNGAIDTKATMFGYGYNTDRKGSKAGYKNMAQGFYAGFRAAERVVKSEVLGSVCNSCDLDCCNECGIFNKEGNA